MTSLCQSCEQASAAVDEHCDNADFPYRLCTACHRRILARALRPYEWFNLARRFGWWQYLLHDDFYQEDGNAMQPEEQVDSVGSRPAPTLTDVENDAEYLFGYALTRWRIDDELQSALSHVPPAELLAVVGRAFDGAPNVGVRSTALQVAALTLKTSADGFVRGAWRCPSEYVDLSSLIQASAACLPTKEGFDLASKALGGLVGRARREAMLALSYFRSDLSLRWIEAHVEEPIAESWGNLAAASAISWSVIERWLQGGRPLSLVAIDALVAIANPRTPLLRSLAPVLLSPPHQERLRSALLHYAECDPVPRVKERVSTALAHSGQLCAGA